MNDRLTLPMAVLSRRVPFAAALLPPAVRAGDQPPIDPFGEAIVMSLGITSVPSTNIFKNRRKREHASRVITLLISSFRRPKWRSLMNCIDRRVSAPHHHY